MSLYFIRIGNLKKNILIIVIFITVSCDTYKSLFIFSRFTIRPNSNSEAFKIVDTTSLYKEVQYIDLKYVDTVNLEKRTYLDYMRFKQNGKLVRMLTDRITDWEYKESKVNRMQRYNYNEKGFFIEYHTYTIQGGWNIRKEKLVKYTEDSLVFDHKGHLTKYLKVNLHNNK